MSGMENKTANLNGEINEGPTTPPHIEESPEKAKNGNTGPPKMQRQLSPKINSKNMEAG